MIHAVIQATTTSSTTIATATTTAATATTTAGTVAILLAVPYAASGSTNCSHSKNRNKTDHDIVVNHRHDSHDNHHRHHCARRQ